MTKSKKNQVSQQLSVQQADTTLHFFNRDLSWLEFNRRVLFQARDQNLPLLERVRFLAIFSSNLDEFFMKRVGYLKRIIKKGSGGAGPDGHTPEQVLMMIRKTVLGMLKERDEIYLNVIVPELKQNGIVFLRWTELSAAEKKTMTEYFREKIFPVLTPLAVDPAHPFPFLSNLSISLGVSLQVPKQDKLLFARIKIPDVLPQWIRVSGDVNALPMAFIRLQDVIYNNLSELFPGMKVLGASAFRVTRNADLASVEEDEDADLLEIVEEELRLRRLAEVVRLQHNPNPDAWVMDLLRAELDLLPEDLYEHTGELSYTYLTEIAALNFPQLKFKPWHSVVPLRLADESRSIFRVISESDLLVHHPYESFSASVEHFIRSAVDDPNVLTIKMTVYRTGELSPFIPLLIEAAESGKQVVCVVEVKAKFDEARNLFWAEKLEKAGVHVVYGVVGFKTHTKISLVVRKEHDHFKFYAHIGTGNYNNETAKIYTDVGLFTCRDAITKELIQIFNYLTGLSRKLDYEYFLVAPINMRQRFEELIDQEIANVKAGKPAGIVIKINNLEDHLICNKLYEASCAGVSIDLIVRGICTLRPGVPGLSENIRVFSIIGRFLEHSRIFYFRSGSHQLGDGLFLIGSADLMARNLNNRMETIVPVEDINLKNDLWQILDTMLQDQWLSWQMQPDGSYHLLRPAPESQKTASHDRLMDLSLSKSRES